MTPDHCDLLCLDLPLAESLRSGLPDLKAVEHAAGRARALADPTRVQIAAALHAGDELCVCDLAWIVGRPQALVSHHVRILRREGLASSRKDGKMVLYRLTEIGERVLHTLLPATSAATA